LERVVGEDVRWETASTGKVAFASFIGTAIEFYIYGTAAALVLAERSSLSSPRPPAL
jgi:hypothetical protein